MTTLRWQPLTTLVLSLIGLGESIYLTITHFDKVALVCSSNATINCEKVTTSPQSEIFGIPVAMLGLLYFVPMVALCLPAAWRSADRRIHQARLALSLVGVGMIIYLIIAELFLIKAICLWCSGRAPGHVPALRHHRHVGPGRPRPRLRNGVLRGRRGPEDPDGAAPSGAAAEGLTS